MMIASRRQLVAGGGALLASSLAGCLDVVTGDPVEFASSPAGVSQSALESAGFSEEHVGEEVVTESVSALGVSRDVRVTNWVSEYERSLSILGADLVDLAVFAAITTPQVRVLGQEFNYVGEYSSADLAAEIQRHYDDLRNVSFESERSIRILGSDRPVGRFRADATFLPTGRSIEVVLSVSDPIERGNEYVACVGVHPRQSPDGDDRVTTLMEGVEHET